MHNQIRIEMTGIGRGKVFVDGVEVPRIARIEFVASAGPNPATTVRLDLLATDILIEAPATLETRVIDHVSVSLPNRDNAL
jgi:hypothetical protein